MKKNLYVVPSHKYGFGSFINKVQGSVNPFTNKYSSGLFKGMSSGLGNAMGAIGSTVGGIAGGAIAGGRESAAGSIINGIGDVASAIPGPWGAIAGFGLKAIGGLTNAAFGVKLNQENINAVNNNIAAMNNFQSNAGDFDALSQNFMSQPMAMNFNQKFIGKNGWFNKGATKKFNELQDKQDVAQQFVDNSLANNMNNITATQSQNLLANYSAYGGPLGMIQGPIDYSMAMQYLDMKNNETQNKLMADGGQLHTHGADWNTGLNYVGNGGSHEENPYDGVPMGIAPDGQPNLVEEGEVIWNNDYVFSKRLKVPKAVRRKYKLGGLKPLSFADAVMKVNKDVEERPNDPIALRGRDAILGALAEVQEIQRTKKEDREQQDTTLQQGMPMIAARGGRLGHRYYNAGWLDLYKDWYNKRHSFDEKDATRVAEVLDNVYQQPLFPVPYVGDSSTWDNDLNYTEDGKNLSKDVMNWFAKQTRLLYSDDYRYRSTPGNEDFFNAYNSLINNKNIPNNLFEGKLSDMADNLLNYANKGKPDVVSKGIQSLYNTYGKSGEDARIRAHLADLNPKILPQLILSPNTLSDPTNVYTIRNNADKTAKNINNFALNVADRNDKSRTDWVSRLRYIPAIGAGIGVLSDIFGWTNKPDYSQADAIARAARGIGTVSASPIGDYLQYRPMDRMFALNMLNANAGGNRRAILNTTAGNRGTAMAGLLASDNNTLNNIGNLWRQAEEYNAQQLEKSKTFNRATNMFNSELGLKAQQANLGRDEVVMRGLQAAAAMRDTIDQRVGAAKSANLTNLFQSLGDIGWEAFNRNMINTNRALYYGIDSDGHIKYKDAFYALPKEMQDVVRERAEIDRKTRALGGRINKRRR